MTHGTSTAQAQPSPTLRPDLITRLDMLLRAHRWSVIWPTRPQGFYTVVVRADDPTDAVRVAAKWELPTADGHSLALDYEPMVWRMKRPYWLRAKQVAGPDYPALRTPGDDAFMPLPLKTGR